MFAATTSETRIGVVLNGFDAKLQALVNAVDICRHGKEHRVLPVATLLDGVEVPQLLVGFRFQSSNFLFLGINGIIKYLGAVRLIPDVNVSSM